MSQNNCEEQKEDNTFFGKKQTSKKIKKEIGGPKGLEPTRYGDWEVNGRVSDF